MRDGRGEELAVVALKSTASMRKPLLRRKRPRRATDPAQAPPPVPVTSLTVVLVEPFTDRAAARDWLKTLRDPVIAGDEIAQGLRHANRVIHAYRLATADPYAQELGRTAALRVRVGYGTGEEVADGDWTEALEVPAAKRSHRSALDTDTPVVELLSGRRERLAGDDLVLRAMLDVDQDRPAQALIQARAAAQALREEGVDEASDWLSQLDRCSAQDAQTIRRLTDSMLKFCKRRMHERQSS